MLKAFILYSVVAVLIIFTCSAASARMVPPFDLQSQAKLADVICTGRITDSVVGTADSDGNADWMLVFRVDRVIKGEVAPGTDIHVHYKDSATVVSRYDGIAGSLWSPVGYGYVLAALVHSADGYVCANGDSSMPVAERQNIPYVHSGDIMTDVRWEIVNSLKDPSLVRFALRQAPILTASQMQTYVDPLLDGAGADVVVSALTGLAIAGRPGAALNYLLAHDGADFTKGALTQVKTGVQNTPAISNEDIPTVSRLMSCKSVALRRVGSYLLRMFHSPSVCAMLQSALADADIEVRYNAVMGLAAQTKNYQYAPAFAIYKAGEDTYLSYWRSKAHN